METKNFTIHIIEDDFVFSKVVSQFLKSIGFTNVKSFNSGKSYLESCEYEKKPDIAIIDYKLDNNITGDLLLDKIKSKSKKSNVIMMSSFFDEINILTKGKQKAYKSISKTTNFNKSLKRTIRRLIVVHRRRIKKRNFYFGVSLFFFLVVITSFMLSFFFGV